MLFLAVDGSSRRNGKPDCLSTGSVFIRNDKGYVDNILVYERNSTNQRGELIALIAALAYADSTDIRNIYIITDSMYLYNAVTKDWIIAWKKKGWKTSKGGDVKNRDLWEKVGKIVDRLSDRELVLYHIKGHLMTLGKVTARNIIELDSTGLSLYNEMSDRYQEQLIRYKDKFEHATKLFNEVHGFLPPDPIFVRLVLLNTVADILAGNYADKVDSESAAQ